jgi:acyl-CoA synthetase (AMP-forming)/AMP-acid ligase II
MNTTEFLYIATAICPERDFIVYDQENWSFSQFNTRVNRLANALKGQGVQKGDRIGMLSVNCPQYVETYFAVAKLGGIFVPLNFRTKPDELAYLIRHAEVTILLAGARYFDMLDQMRSDPASIKTYISIDEKQNGALFYDDLILSSSSDEVEGDIDDDDITILMYTAGTTGRPKAVPLRHSSFVSYILNNLEPADPEIGERNLLTVPLYHVAGIQAMLAGAYGGRTLVMMPQFEVKAWLNNVQKHQVTRAMLVPTMLKWVIEDPEFDTYDLSSLGVITYGAAPMPLNVITEAIAKMPGVQFINAFGQTETASTITVLGPEDHIINGTDEEKEQKLRRLASSIGKPLSDVQVKIVDDQKKILPSNSIGEIYAKGPRMMKGYWGSEEDTATTITEGGWLKTGDRGWMDEDGYIYLDGRGDDMIIRGGENISPKEIEDVLHSHPKIDEAAVIGLPDLHWGQQAHAIVVVRKEETVDSDEIMAYCKTRLAGFKRPASVVFIDALPRNPLGKVLKKELKETYGKG